MTTCRGTPLRRPVVVSHSVPHPPGFGLHQTEPAARRAQERAMAMPEGHNEPARLKPCTPTTPHRCSRLTLTGHDHSVTLRDRHC